MPAHWIDLEPEDLDDEVSPDDAVEIAGDGGPRIDYARRILLEGGRLLFAEDLPMESRWVSRAINYRGGDGQSHHLEFLRKEYKVPSGKNSVLNSGDQLHIALRPFSNLHSLAVPFRGAVHHGTANRLQRFGLLLHGEEPSAKTGSFVDDEAARHHVEANSADYWENDKRLTAGFSAVPHREGKRSRNSWKGDYAVYGICPKGIDGVRELQISEVAGKLLLWTDLGSFPFKRDSGLHLHAQVKEQAMDWLEWAAHQALAGPIEYIDTPGGLPIGTPVERLLIRRYRNLLIHAHRDITAARRKGEAGSGAAVSGRRAHDDEEDDSDPTQRQLDRKAFDDWGDEDADDPTFVSFAEAEDELEGLL